MRQHSVLYPFLLFSLLSFCAVGCKRSKSPANRAKQPSHRAGPAASRPVSRRITRSRKKPRVAPLSQEEKTYANAPGILLECRMGQRWTPFETLPKPQRKALLGLLKRLKAIRQRCTFRRYPRGCRTWKGQCEGFRATYGLQIGVQGEITKLQTEQFQGCGVYLVEGDKASLEVSKKRQKKPVIQRMIREMKKRHQCERKALGSQKVPKALWDQSIRLMLGMILRC